jgi:adenine-specific DNA-methyltransferase
VANSQRSIFPLAASHAWAAAPDAELGAVFTRRWVVEFILDLVGYTSDKDLGGMSIVEPACGRGAFLTPIVERLVASCKQHGRHLESARCAIRAFDLQPASVQIARHAAQIVLEQTGVDSTTAGKLADGWIQTADFLLADHELKSADFVVGNPPYIRLESVPPEVSDAYRRACPTMRGRADIYIGFFEVGLDLLNEGGSLAFICADRWMHNQYGSALRALVNTRFSVEAVIALHDAPVFEDDVSAYPAITVLRSAPQHRAHVVQTNHTFGASESLLKRAK